MGNNPSSSPKAHIETARKSGVCQLANLKLTELPGEIKVLKGNLRNLDVSRNKLQIIPPWINELGQLRGLDLSENKIGSLPEVGSLRKLETLVAENNCLSYLPSSLGDLTSLRRVVVCRNALSEFPVQLCRLRHLEYVDVSGNRITGLPQEIGGLQAMELNLNQNQLSRLPESLADCPRLKVLRLEENCLPLPAFSPRLLKDSKVSTLQVEGNVFDMKDFNNLEGYDQYMQRFTDTKKKMN